VIQFWSLFDVRSSLEAKQVHYTIGGSTCTALSDIRIRIMGMEGWHVNKDAKES